MNRNVNGSVYIGTPLRFVPPYTDEQGFHPAMVFPSTRLPLALSEINNLQMPDYQALRDRIVGGVDHRRYDTNVVMAATDLLAKTHNYFDKKVHANDRKTLDGGTTIADLDETYTNMLEESKIEEGWTLIVESLQVDLILSHRDFNAFAANTGHPSTGAPSVTDTNSATNVFLALCRTCHVQWESIGNVTNEIFAQGRIDDFPSDRTICAEFGGATSEGVIGNFNYDGEPEYLRSPVVLQSQHLFKAYLQAMRTLTCPLNAEIGIGLQGLLVPSGN